MLVILAIVRGVGRRPARNVGAQGPRGLFLHACRRRCGKGERRGGRCAWAEWSSAAPSDASGDGVTTRFIVEDGEARVPVTYRGILPDLFREGSGVVAEGKLAADRSFVADNILAKHDERYMPPELGNQDAEHKAGQTLKR